MSSGAFARTGSARYTSGVDPRIEALLRVPEIRDRRLGLVGLLSKELAARGLPPPVIVGGHAVEIYTFGAYATQDVDLLCADTKAFGEACASLGLARRGRHWLQPEIPLAVELGANEFPDRINEILVDGAPVRIISLEDLVIDRLNAYVWWKSTQDGDWAEMLLRLHRPHLDMAYLEKRATEEDVLAALREVLARPESSATEGAANGGS